MLEVIRQHSYEKSKFLRGAVVDESKIIETTTPPLTAETLTYLNPNMRPPIFPPRIKPSNSMALIFETLLIKHC